MTSEELEELVRPTVDGLATLVFSSGNLPSSLGSTRDRLVQWCHGAPGSVYLFGKAYQVIKGPIKFNIVPRMDIIVLIRK